MDDRFPVTECIAALEEERNSINPFHEYGHSDYRYDAESGRCLYRTNWTSGIFEEDDQFEKFIIDAFTGETLAKYAEQNGDVIEGDITDFAAAVDHWFPKEQWAD